MGTTGHQQSGGGVAPVAGEVIPWFCDLVVTRPESRLGRHMWYLLLSVGDAVSLIAATWTDLIKLH